MKTSCLFVWDRWLHLHPDLFPLLILFVKTYLLPASAWGKAWGYTKISGPKIDPGWVNCHGLRTIPPGCCLNLATILVTWTLSIPMGCFVEDENLLPVRLRSMIAPVSWDVSHAHCNDPCRGSLFCANCLFVMKIPCLSTDRWLHFPSWNASCGHYLVGIVTTALIWPPLHTSNCGTRHWFQVSILVRVC